MENLLNKINKIRQEQKNSVNGKNLRLVQEITKNELMNSKELKEMFSFYCPSVLQRKLNNIENWGRVFTEKVNPKTNFGRPLNFYFEYVCKDGLKLINKIETTTLIHCGGFQRVDLHPMDKIIEVDGKMEIEKSNEYVMEFRMFDFKNGESKRITKERKGRKFITDNFKMQFVTDL